jgi:hypothetical protein
VRQAEASLNAAPVGWGAVSAWALSVFFLAFVGLFRLVVDGLTCGDDGPVDYYGDPEAKRWCAFLDDDLGAFAISHGASVGPGSINWFLLAIPVALVGGALGLRSVRSRGVVIALAAGWAVFGLVVLPSLSASPGFVLFYVVPTAVPLVAGLVALGLGLGRVAIASLVLGAIVSVLLVFPSFAVAGVREPTPGRSETTAERLV